MNRPKMRHNRVGRLRVDIVGSCHDHQHVCIVHLQQGKGALASGVFRSSFVGSALLRVQQLVVGRQTPLRPRHHTGRIFRTPYQRVGHSGGRAVNTSESDTSIVRNQALVAVAFFVAGGVCVAEFGHGRTRAGRGAPPPENTREDRSKERSLLGGFFL